MSYLARAVVSRELNSIGVETIHVGAPERGEVTVRVAACGVCHSDLSVANGVLPLPQPIVLGHEASGVVVAVGEGVQGFAIGDHVVSSFVSVCRACRFCMRGRPNLCEQTNASAWCLPGGGIRTRDTLGMPLNSFSGCGVMAQYATLNVANLLRIRKDVPLDCAALVSCAVLTGAGAVFNRAQVTPGARVLVLGAGGVGLNVIQAAKAAGAIEIVAVDLSPSKEGLALSFGATGFVTWGDGTLKALRERLPEGFDYAFECVGSAETVELAYRCLDKGGLAVIVGVAPRPELASFRIAGFTFEEKAVTGSYFGSCVPERDVPKLLEMYVNGCLELEKLITRRYGIEDAVLAFDDLKNGRNARGLVVF
jgi:Zn-dependent alcohol dehydrogenase